MTISASVNLDNQIKPTLVCFVLDESGSMENVRDSVISGFNEYVGSLKRKPGEFLMTLSKFDSNGVRTPYNALPIANVPDLTRGNYQPGAGTPLYDAVCLTVKGVEKLVSADQSPIVAIMTDGMENASRGFIERNPRELVTRLEGAGNWTFVFMGANQDSWAVAQQFGIQRGNVADWQANERETRIVMHELAHASMGRRERVIAPGERRTSTFFRPEDENG